MGEVIVMAILGGIVVAFFIKGVRIMRDYKRISDRAEKEKKEKK